MKPAGYSPVYAALYPQFAEITRKHGYALAIHGTMNRDFDVVALPWAETVSTPSVVVAELIKSFALTSVGEPTEMRYGRICYTLSIGFGECFADVSFMPVPEPSQ